MKTGKIRKEKRRMWIVILSILGTIGVTMGVGILATAPGRQELMDINIAALDFKKLRDGTYIGQYCGTKDHFRDAKVEVTVSSGKVSSIKVLEGKNVYKEGKPIEIRNGLTIEDLNNSVIKEQSLQVDVISGATLTSNAYLKAMENALKQAQTK
ncbi:FMN-binding protein [Clostridium sporogenes]|uniref:FMN-binding protein n=1 Tax=Clostridium sporogenes TaxID=1509 RepID=UPI001969F4FF|nr:FMN-binding protein [Clostridium sporogenes]